VAKGRETGIYDNWADCKQQVDGYSHNDYKSFDNPAKALDYVDRHSSDGKAVQSGEASSYQRTDYMEGRNNVVVRECSYRRGTIQQGYVEKFTRTSWKNK